MTLPLPGAQPAGRQCSARGCRREASYALLWRNPKIHPEDRHKTWLACEQHRQSLTEFLSLRAFPLRVVPIEELPAD